MNFQSFVNETFHRLARQGCQSMMPNTYGSRCAYRGTNGTKCAIGMWIEDAQYDHILEGAGVKHDIVLNALPAAIVNFGLFALGDLQWVHDRPENWKSPNHLWTAMNDYAHAHRIVLDPTIWPEIWAGWKGQPPGDLPETPVAAPKNAIGPSVKEMVYF